MRDVEASIGDAVTGFVADLTGHSPSDRPPASAAGEEWLAVLRERRARQNCGLVSIANPGDFSWPGHWIGIVDPADTPGEPVGVLLFGTPSAVIASPDAPQLVGRGVEELNFQQALILVPFDPFAQVALDGSRTLGEVVGIFVTDVKTAPMRSLPVTKAIPGKGLEGDRYAAGAGTFTPRS